jgi:L-asparaginase
MRKYRVYLTGIIASVSLFVFAAAGTLGKDGLIAKHKLTSHTSTPGAIALQANKSDLPKIVILATGGTIAGTAASSTQSGYTSGQVTIDAMLNAVPDAKKIADLRGEQISNVGSQDMSFEILLKLANRINELTKSGDADGIVITHGTDVMEESAYFLNLVVKTEKPVALVGSMRPSTAMSADGPLNLYNAISVAADPNAKNRGVMVIMNDWIHSSQCLVKTSTTDVQTFMSPMHGLIGISSYGKNEYYRYPSKKYGKNSEFSIEGVKKMPRVDIVYACADMAADLIDASVERGAKGIIIAGVGNGNMNKASIEACHRAVMKGVVVVRSTRVATGVVGRDVEINDAEVGTIASLELNPQKARILLAVALLKSRTPNDLQRIFREY